MMSGEMDIFIRNEAGEIIWADVGIWPPSDEVIYKIMKRSDILK